MRDRLLKFAQPLVLHAQSLAVRMLKGTTLGVRVVATSEEGVMLVRHSYVPGWYLPGGAVDPGETAEEAVARELDEETGLAPDAALTLHGVFFNRKMARRDHVLVYRVPAVRRVRAFIPNGEIREARFFPIDQLPADATQATKLRVGEIFFNQPVGSDWG